MDSSDGADPDQNGSQNQSSNSRQRRRSALAERLTTMVSGSLRRPSLTTLFTNNININNNSNSSTPSTSNSASNPNSRSNVDLTLRSPNSSTSASASSLAPGGLGVGRISFLRSLSAGTSRDHSSYTTEDEFASSEGVPSPIDNDDPCDFGLLEADPFANLSAPPSECHSPASRLWLRLLTTTPDIIREVPEENEDPKGTPSMELSPINEIEEPKRLSMGKRASSLDSATKLREANHGSSFWEDYDHDGDVSAATTELDHDYDHRRSRHHSLRSDMQEFGMDPDNFGTPATTPGSSPQLSQLSITPRERKRTSSLTQRVRNIVQSRPSLPTLSLLANTKIFMPGSGSGSKSNLASRFPSEPWDNPTWNSSLNSGLGLAPGSRPSTPSQSTPNLVGERFAVPVSNTIPLYPTAHTTQGGAGGGNYQERSGQRSSGQYYQYGNGGNGGWGGSSDDGYNRRPSHGGSSGGHGGDDGRDDRFPPSRGGSSQTTSEDPTTTETSDDSDVPLGQRPNALKAQKSLRQKIKDERRSRKETMKPKPLAPSSLHPAAHISQYHPHPQRSSTEGNGGIVSADDLTARLLRLRATDSSGPTSPTGKTAFPVLPVPPHTDYTGSGATSPRTAIPPVSSMAPMGLVPPGAKSPLRERFSPFNSPPIKSQAPVPSSLAFPGSDASNSAPLRRHATDAVTSKHSKTRDGDAFPQPRVPERSMTSFESPHSGAGSGHNAGYEHASASGPGSSMFLDRGRRSLSRPRADSSHAKVHNVLTASDSARKRATSLHSSAARPAPPVPLPPLPTFNQGNTASFDYGSGNATGGGQDVVMQQRFFIGDMQRFSVVDLGARTNARDVLQAIESKGDLSAEEISQGNWMLFEMANDFGMERPIREYEIVLEIYNSWNSDTRMNYFMLKRTPLAPILATSAMPKSSPACGGYVEWEQKRGKWTKRWLELREHSLWLSKKQGAKDATVVCTLSNFDAYVVTRVHKSPKPFIFSVKSVQNMRLFERVSDYHHAFCCEPSEGTQWVQNILLARSYLLQQERTVLFRNLNQSPAASQTPPTPHTARPLARSTTRRPAPSPLLAFGASGSAPAVPQVPQSASAAIESFQPMPGSLLAKRA